MERAKSHAELPADESTVHVRVMWSALPFRHVFFVGGRVSAAYCIHDRCVSFAFVFGICFCRRECSFGKHLEVSIATSRGRKT